MTRQPHPAEIAFWDGVCRVLLAGIWVADRGAALVKWVRA